MTTPVVPKPAATILLLRDDPLRVLMVKRHEQAFFPNALVFPGGKVDPEDHAEDWLDHVTGHHGLAVEERALRIAACRETWEEAGMFATANPLHPLDRSAPTFRELVARSGARLDLSALVRFGHWITPPQVPKRFDTHFFLARAPEEGDAFCDNEGGEIVLTEWVEPSELIERAAAGDPSIMFSTLMNAHRLGESRTVEDALAAARVREVVTVLPQREEVDGELWVRIPENAGYPVSRVKAVVRFAGK